MLSEDHVSMYEGTDEIMEDVKPVNSLEFDTELKLKFEPLIDNDIFKTEQSLKTEFTDVEIHVGIFNEGHTMHELYPDVASPLFNITEVKSEDSNLNPSDSYDVGIYETAHDIDETKPSFSENDMEEDDEESELDKHFQCVECGMYFARSAELQSHMHSHTAGNVCIKCGKLFRSERLLQRHEIICRATYTEIATDGLRGKQADTNLSEIITDDLKSKQVYTNLSEHDGTTSLHSLDETKPGTSKTIYLVDMDESDTLTTKKVIFNSRIKTCNNGGHQEEGRQFKCDICEKCFKKKTHLQDHYRIHTLPHVCDVCGISFSRKYLMTSHRKIHSLPKYEKCGKHITDRDSHKCAKWNEPMACQVCQKFFVKSLSLKKHMLTHSGRKDFECTMCEKKFVDKAGLTRHITMHTGEMKYQCRFCGRRFRDRTSLCDHEKMHTGTKSFMCDLCSASFTRSTQLKAHLDIHNGNKRYQCTVCGQTFTQQNHLKNHMVTHTKEKEFVCLYCHCAYTRFAILKNHCNAIHNRDINIKTWRANKKISGHI